MSIAVAAADSWDVHFEEAIRVMQSDSEIELCYGRSGIKVRLPEQAEVVVIRKPAMPVIADPRAAVLQAIHSPVEATPRFRGTLGGSNTFPDVVRRSRTASIAICDITRPVPNHLFLRPLIEHLIQLGMDRRSINVIVATGLHRPNDGDELRELVGDDWVLENVQVWNHNARYDEHVDLGRTPTRGTPVKINRRFAEADLRIVSGLVEPHFMAGYSGGRKVIAPGLAHCDTISTFHNYRFMSDPSAINCNLDQNPLHEEQLEIVRMLGGAYSVNTVIDENRDLSYINFGEIQTSHQLAVEYIQKFCRVAIPRPFETVVTSSAGYPLDKTYYQTVKGMVGAMDILAPGGNLYVVSECSEGIGSPEYIQAQRRLTRQGIEPFLNSLKEKRLAEIDEWQTQMQTKAVMKGNVYLYSGLGDVDRMLTGVECIDNLETHLQTTLQNCRDHRIAVIPEGPYVIPYVDSSG